MRIHALVLPIALVQVVGCAGGRSRVIPETADRAHEMRRAAIGALLESLSTPLAVDPSCARVGSKPTDATIGDYVGNLLAEFTGGRNAIVSDGRASPSGDRGGPVLDCSVELLHADSEDEWRWGVRFMMRGSDGKVVPGSIRCSGAG